MSQRTALWVCISGPEIPAGWQLEYDVLLEKVHARGSVLSRDLVAAHAYVARPEVANTRFDGFVRYLHTLGYVVHVVDRASIPLKATHALLLAAVSGRVDTAVLVWPHRCGGNGDSGVGDAFGEGLAYARAHGLEVVVWGTEQTPASLRSGPFRDLEQLGVVKMRGRG